MSTRTTSSGLPPLLATTVDEAIGRGHRHDPVTGRSGGPAGNARLTAVLGLLLLVLFLAELVTLLDVNGLISWHVVLGTLLVPPALAKTASTGWRIARYYRGHRTYVQAGPPPTLLRLLGPAVVASTLGLLASGLLLIVLGPTSSRTVIVSALGQQVDWVTVHQGMFILFGVFTGLHLLARFVPALRLTVARAGETRRVPGRASRWTALLVTAAVAAVSAAVVLAASGPWQNDTGWRHDGGPGSAQGQYPGGDQ